MEENGWKEGRGERERERERERESGGGRVHLPTAANIIFPNGGWTSKKKLC